MRDEIAAVFVQIVAESSRHRCHYQSMAARPRAWPPRWHPGCTGSPPTIDLEAEAKPVAARDARACRNHWAPAC